MPRSYLIAAICCLFIGAGVVTADDAKVSDLVKQLKSDVAQTQIEACEQLMALGPQAEPAVADLSQLLASSDNLALKRACLLALAEIGPPAAPALPTLSETMKSSTDDLRAYAAHAIGALGPAAQAAVPTLIPYTTDQDVNVRRAVLRALRKIGAQRDQVRPLVVKALKSADPADATAAISTLAEEGEVAVPGLIEALGDQDAAYWACLALAEIGPSAKAAVPALQKLLDSDEPDLRLQALVTMGEIGPDAAPAVPRIAQVLTGDPFENVQAAAAYALGAIGQKRVAAAALRAGLNQDDPLVRVASAWALLKLEDRRTPAIAIAVKRVLDGVESNDPHVRAVAARALADPAIPEAAAGRAFRRALQGMDDPDRVARIVSALASLGERAVPICIRSLENQGKLREHALQVLIQIGPQAAPAVPALTATLKDTDAGLRRESLFALGAVGPKAAESTEAIARCLSDDDSEVKYAACYALGKIGPEAAAALPSLHKAIESDDSFLRLAAVWGALKIRPDDQKLQQQAVPILAKTVTNTDSPLHVRAEAAGLLGDMGKVAEPAISALQAAAKDEDSIVQQAAQQALRSIQTPDRSHD
jgi:HEAT repeat protein